MFNKNKHKIRTLLKRTAATVSAAAILLTGSLSASAVQIKYDWNSSDNPVFTKSFSAVNNGVGSITANKSKVVPFKATGEEYYAMCVLPGTGFASDYTDIDGVMVIPNMDEYGNYWESWYRDNRGEWTKDVSTSQKKFIALCSYYGYPYAKTDLSYFYATQVLSWEIIMGYRTCDTSDSSSFTNTYNGIKFRDYLNFKTTSALNSFKKAYNDLEKKVAIHYTRPSALSADETTAEKNAISMTYDWKTMKYTASFNIGNGYMDTSSPSNYRELIHDLGSNGAGFNVSYTTGTTSTKITVSTKEAFESTRTIFTERRMDKDIPKELQAKVYKKYGDQTLLKGTVDPDPYFGYISFKIQNMPNVWIEKEYKNGDGSLVINTELENCLEDTRFRMSTTANGTTYYVKAVYDSERDMYVFSELTTDKSQATSFHTLRTVTEDNNIVRGRFAVLDLPSKESSSVKYKVEEIASATGYGTTSATVTVPSYTDNSTKTVKLVNNGADYGSVDMTKIMLDESGNQYDVTNYDVAQEMINKYRNTAFVVGVMTDDGIKYITSTGAGKYPDAMGSHILKGTSAERFSGYDGRWYAAVEYIDDKGTIAFRDGALNSDISKAAIFQPASETNLVGDTYEICQYFGSIHFECIPTDENGNTLPMIFIEVGHAENFGHDETLGAENTVDFSYFDSISKEDFSSFSGLIQFPEGTVVNKGMTREYVLDPNSYYPAAVAATEDGEIRYASTDIYNQYYHVSLVLHKQDSDTEQPVSGAVYGLYSAENDLGSLIGTTTTDENGDGRFDTSIKSAVTYYVHEIEAPLGYAIDTEWHEVTFQIGEIPQNLILNSYQGEFDATMRDEPYKLDLVLNKTDGKNTIPVTGAEFDVITDQELTAKETAKLSDSEYAGKAYAAGDVVGKIVTDENGFAEYYGLPLGGVNHENTDAFNYTYDIVETFVPAPYVLDSAPYTVVTSLSDVSADKTAEKNIALAAETADIINYPQLVELTVEKKNDSGKPLEGVIFDVYAAEDVVINGVTIQPADSLIGTMSPTDADGKAYSVYIKSAEAGEMGGDYTYSIPIYPGFKYKLTEDVTTVPEYYEPLSEPVEFTAEYGGMELETVEFSKTIINYEKSGTVEVRKTTEGMLNLGGIDFTLSGTSDAGTEVNITAATDENGLALFEHIPLGTYTVTEDNSSTPYAYLTADPVEVEVFYAQTTVQEIHNDEKTGSVQIQKTTEGMLNLGGIDFTLSGTSDSGREISIYATTDESGLAVFKNIPIGTYTVTESSETIPYAYLTADPIEVNVYYAETTTQEIHNDEKTGTFEVHKTTKGMTDLEGISFVLAGTSDSGRDISITAVTDENGIATFENIPIGTYTITEVKSTVPAGYLVADATDVEVFYAETTTAEIFNDTTKVKVSKQDITTGEELPGAHLEVIDKDGNIVEEWISTNEPHMIEGVLIAGEEYTLRETIAPDGYKVATDIKFTVAEDGSVQTVIMHDEVIPSTPGTPSTSTPSTPTTPNPSTGTAVAGISVVLGAFCILLLSKRKNTDE